MTPIFAKAYPPNEVTFLPDDCENRKEPTRVLLCEPTYFEVVEGRNVYMQNNIGKVNKEKAKSQWDHLHTLYLQLKASGILDDVLVVEGAEHCEDMVFCANQSFPWTTWSGEKIVVMSNMKHEARQNEVVYFEDFYKDHGYRIFNLQGRFHFEGMGDMIAHPGKRMLYGGYGLRTDKQVYDEVSRTLDTPIVLLELVNENFYHLDTCFLPLNANELLIAPGAFSDESLVLIKKMFEAVYEIPMQEAVKGFACNAHVIYGPKNKSATIIQKNNPVTLNILQHNSSQVLETDTSEFMKSGGSVFCMKMMVY
ncbi:MAG: dimethylarginine dimethylaminohydrolase family protein [Chitinophagales bacterium]